MDETNLIKRVREETVPGNMKKRGLCINDARDRNKWRQRCRRVVALANWEDSAVEAEWRI